MEETGRTTAAGAGRSHLIKSDLNRTYPTIDRGEGIYLFDRSGRRYLDGCSGAVVANIGHGIAEIREAMRRQAERIAFVYRTQFTSEPAEELAARLARLAPGDLDRVFFVNSGSEATEAAMRLAIQYWRERGRPGKTRIVSRHASYHGVTLGALSMSGHDGRRHAYEPILHGFPAVPAVDGDRCVLEDDPGRRAAAWADDWERALLRLGADTVAAVIAEPIVGAAGGALTAPSGYFRTLREICDRHGTLLIADEVMTGLGRTGAWFASEQEGIVPDLVAVGKGMSAGYTPMSAVIVRAPIVEAMRAGSGAGGFGHTYSANPLGAAVCLAVLDYIERNDLLRAARERGAELRRGLEALRARHGSVGNVRGRGLMLGVEVVADDPRGASRAGAPTPAARLVEHAFDRGLLVYPAGFPPYRTSILVTPPLTITSAQISELLSLLDGALADFEASRRRGG